MQGSFIAGGGHFWKTGSGFLLGSYSGRSSHSRGLGDMQCFHTCSLGHSMGQHWEGPMAGWGRQLQGMGLGLCIPAKCLFLVWKSDYLPQSTSSFPTSCVEFDKHLFSFFLPSCYLFVADTTGCRFISDTLHFLLLTEPQCVRLPLRGFQLGRIGPPSY